MVEIRRRRIEDIEQVNNGGPCGFLLVKRRKKNIVRGFYSNC